MDCLIYLKHNGTFHGDIKPSTIFIHPKTQVVQLVDSYFANNGRTGYEIVN
jgi:serine/threonine protein kinase